MPPTRLQNVWTTRRVGEPLSLNNALRAATEDPQFASAFLKEPRRFKEIYNLSDDEIKAIEVAGRSVDIDVVIDQTQAID